MDKVCYLYRHFDGDRRLLYVGIALCAVIRNETHRRIAPWFSEVRSIEIEEFPSHESASAAELSAVARERPKYNVRLAGRGRISLPSRGISGRRIAARLDAETKAALAKAAKADQRSLSSMAEKIIADWLLSRPHIESME